MAPAWYAQPAFYFSNPLGLVVNDTPVFGPAGCEELDYALELGLIDEMVAPDGVYDAAAAWASRFVDGPRSAFAAAKAGIDGVYCVGPLMRHLYDLLPAGKGLGWHDDPATLKPSDVASLLKAGDVVVVKGSKKMFWVNKFVPRLVAALQARAQTG